MREESRRDRRKVWLNRLVSIARRRGDKRPRESIVASIEDRSDAISRAFNEARRDRETSETIVREGHHYSLGDKTFDLRKGLDLHEGVVLTRSLVHIDPALIVS
jgi:hypothetical protein